MYKLFVLTFLTLLSSPSVFAQRTLDVLRNNSSYLTPMVTGTQPRSVLESTGTQYNVIETLFGEQNGVVAHIPPGSIPGFPRYWGTEGISGYIDKTFGGAISGPISASVSFNYKYENTISFHYIGPLQLNMSGSDPYLNPVAAGDFEQILQKDTGTETTPGTFLDYFLVSSTNPMVGICQYELALYHGLTANGGLTFYLRAMVETSNVRFAKFSVYSKPFVLMPKPPLDTSYEPGQYSLKWYLEEECNNRFNSFVKPYADEVFASRALEYNAYHHPSVNCNYANKEEIPGEGDESCYAFRQNSQVFYRNSTVTRCEISRSGAAQCVHRARENMNCTMYMDRNGGYSSTPQGLYSEVTNSHISTGTCDRGLTCTMDREPLRVGRLVLWPGRALCRRL